MGAEPNPSDEARTQPGRRAESVGWRLTDPFPHPSVRPAKPYSRGYWRVVPCADRPGIVRVWFCVSVQLSKRVPGFVVRLVSRLGLDKATRWLTDLEQAT